MLYNERVSGIGRTTTRTVTQGACHEEENSTSRTGSSSARRNDSAYKTNNYYSILMKGGVTHDPVLEKDR